MPVDEPRVCTTCNENVVVLNKEEGCPFCGAAVHHPGDLIDEVYDRLKEK